MIVQELIDALKLCDFDAKVVIYNADYGDFVSQYSVVQTTESEVEIK